MSPFVSLRNPGEAQGLYVAIEGEHGVDGLSLDQDLRRAVGIGDAGASKSTKHGVRLGFHVFGNVEDPNVWRGPHPPEDLQGGPRSRPV